MTKQDKRSMIVDYLNSLADHELVATHNEYCTATNDFDSLVYSMDDFDEIMGNSNPLWIVSRAFYGSFNPNNMWFWFDGYGNLTSSDFIDELPIYNADIANYCVEHNNDLEDSNIAEILFSTEETEQ